jgi:single-strand DNA-binding protein
VLVNQRRHNNEGERVDAEPTRLVVRAFKTLAENIVESLAKGDRVFVHGTVTTDAWTDQQSGEKRTAQRVLAEVVGPRACAGPRRGSSRPPAPQPPRRHRTTTASTGPDQRPDHIEEGRPVRSTPGARLGAGECPAVA